MFRSICSDRQTFRGQPDYNFDSSFLRIILLPHDWLIPTIPYPMQFPQIRAAVKSQYSSLAIGPAACPIGGRHEKPVLFPCWKAIFKHTVVIAVKTHA